MTVHCDNAGYLDAYLEGNIGKIAFLLLKLLHNNEYKRKDEKEEFVMRITYYGHSAVMVEVGGKRVLIDPFFDGNPVATTRAVDVHADYIVITHGHGDHIADAESIAKRNDATIIATHELAEYYDWHGHKTHGMGIGGGYNFEFGHVRFTPAFHSSSLELPETKSFIYMGMPAGVIISGKGKSLYHAGDTGLFSDMKLIGELYHPDIAMLPIGDNYTMGPREALIAAQWTGAKTVIPIHYNTFPVIKQDGDLFVAELKKKGINGIALRPGESYLVE